MIQTNTTEKICLRLLLAEFNVIASSTVYISQRSIYSSLMNTYTLRWSLYPSLRLDSLKEVYYALES